MHPLLYVLEFGDIQRPIGSYGVMLSVAIIVGALIALRSATRVGLDAGATIAACGFIAGGALVGAFSMFVLVEFVRTGEFLRPIQEGGLVFYGAPMGGGLALLFATRVLELPLLKWADACIGGIPAAHAMGRLGCFFGGCCFGKASDVPWAVRYTHPIAPASIEPILRHPTPLYEAALLLGLAWGLFLYRRWDLGSGKRLGAYLVAYAVIRSVVELTRGDMVRGVAYGISTSQGISIFVFAFGAFLLYRARNWKSRELNQASP